MVGTRKYVRKHQQHFFPASAIRKNQLFSGVLLLNISLRVVENIVWCLLLWTGRADVYQPCGHLMSNVCWELLTAGLESVTLAAISISSICIRVNSLVSRRDAGYYDNQGRLPVQKAIFFQRFLFQMLVSEDRKMKGKRGSLTNFPAKMLISLPFLQAPNTHALLFGGWQILKTDHSS